MRKNGAINIIISLGPVNFACNIIYFLKSVVNKQYKSKQVISFGLEKTFNIL